MVSRRLRILGLVLAGCTAAATSLHCEPLRIQVFDGPDSVAMTGLKAFADDLRAASGGEIDIEIVAPARLAAPDQTLDAMASGLLDGHYASPAYFAARDPAFALLGDTLALYPDADTRDRWISEGGGLELGREIYARHGARLVTFVHWPEEWLVMIRPASILADLAGRRIRASRGPVGDLLDRAGVTLVQLGGRDTVQALEAGRIDGADWSTLAANLAAGLYREGRFAVRAGHSMPLLDLTVSASTWERLSPAARDLFERKAAEFAARQRQGFRAAEVAARSEVARRGAVLLEMSKASRERLRRLSLSVFDAWATRSADAAAVAASHRAFLERLGLVEASATPNTGSD